MKNYEKPFLKHWSRSNMAEAKGHSKDSFGDFKIQHKEVVEWLLLLVSNTLGSNSMGSPETWHHNFDPQR